MSKRIITMSMVLFALLGNLSHSYSQEICYTIADGYDKLYSLNPETGAVSFIGSTGVGNTESSALSQNGDTLYTANGNVFGWINLSTGTFTSIATIGSLQNGPEGSESVTDIDAMTTDVDGTIWAVERHDNGDLIFKINRKTGQPISNAFGSNMDYIQVQTTGSVPDRLDAIAIDPTTGILYASANNQSSSADDNYIITINKSNGVGTSIGLPDVGDIEGMTFTSTGQMIVTTGHQGYDKLFKINKANASSTYVGTFSTDSDFETCACAGQVDINPNTISGVVFKDTDGDGELDEGDNLWQNAKVRLFEDSNCNGEKDGSAVDSALTDMNGSYAFMVSGVESSTGSITVQINNNANDVEERSDGSITSSSTDLDFESGTIVGMRFTSVDIPQGATITSAYINFYAEETDGSASSTKIRGEKSGNASAFTSSSYSLSNRTKTAGYTSWSIPSWTTGNWYQTPDITNIIQEIVNQGGWSANNAMVLFVEHLGGDDRQAESHDGYSSKAPKLVIEYTSGSSSECYVVEIDTTTLPTGFDMTTSTTQTASFSGSEESNENNNFGFELTTTGSNTIRGTVFNDASNDGELNNGENGTQNVTVELYRDLNCDGVINGLDNKVADTLSASSGSYSFSQAFSCSGTSSSTFTKRIASSNDDVYQKSDGEMRFTNSDVDLGEDLVGLRYDGIEIPQGATITSAKLKKKKKSDRSESTVLRIYGHKTLDADEFSNTDYDLSGRTKTSAYTVYSPSAWETGQSYESSDFSSVIQEIVDQQDWESGNALALILDDVSGKREAKTYDYDSEKGALLEIEFNTSSCTQCYIVRVVEGDLPSGSSLTTESSYEVTFTSVGNTSEDNDFGHYSMSSNGYTCYSISDANDALYTVNPSTGGSIFIGYTGVGNLESSAISFDGDTLYSIDGNDFGWVNLSTGDFTKVGDISTLQNGSLGAVSVTDVDAMTTGSDNSIYAVERYTGGDLIFKVNPATGDYVANAFGYQKDYIQLSTPSGVSNRLDAIGINPLTGVMYASANGQSSSANDNDIITIDLNTGVGTLIGNAGVGDLEGMTFNNAGKLFVTSGKDGYNTNKLYEINLSTGAATLIGALGGSDFETFACPGQDPQANLITGTVFHDANLNAFEDGDENGQSGVMVYLYDDVNGNGLLDGSDALVDSVESDGLGGYTFSVSYTSGTDYFIIITDTAD
ncbi:MAG: hypothetical protein KDC76_12295, partial [Bacteroidetes bacterium]|nr:hypothetical protein [Bacteroidota bacterium]